MEKRHVNAKFDCYQLLKILEEIVVKDCICLENVSIGISIDDDCLEACRVSNGISLRSNSDGDYLLVFCYKE